MELKQFKCLYETKSQFIKARFKVKNLEIFGSFARGEQKINSDLDVLVEFYEPVDLITFIELEGYLSELFKIKVDLVSKNALKPRIRNIILKEAIPL